MDPRNAHRGFREREERRKNANKQKVIFIPKEDKMKTKINGVIVLVLAIAVIVSLLLSGCGAAGEYSPEEWHATETAQAREAAIDQLIANADQATPAATEAPAPTEALTEAPATADVPAATEAPISTEVPVVKVSTAVSCDTPSIQSSIDGLSANEYGEYLDTVLGERMTFTSRKVIVPAKAWNDPLTADELRSVETTWLQMQVCIPDGMIGRIFAFAFEQGSKQYKNGVLMTLNPGLYEFKMRNGEVVIWYPDQESFASDDLVRIIEQIKVGNFDIKAPLAFFGVTTDLLPQIPSQLVKDRNVQIVSFPIAK